MICGAQFPSALCENLKKLHLSYDLATYQMHQQFALWIILIPSFSYSLFSFNFFSLIFRQIECFHVSLLQIAKTNISRLECFHFSHHHITKLEFKLKGVFKSKNSTKWHYQGGSRKRRWH